jgi:hypothetical protein
MPAMPIMPPSAEAFFKFEAANDEAANDLWRAEHGAESVERVAGKDGFQQLVYLSSSRLNWTASELDRLLTRARIHNGARGITGMLLYAGGNFLQALEGPAALITPLMERIRADKRHWHVRPVILQQVACRDFPDRSMGFCRCEPENRKMDAAAFSQDGGFAERMMERQGFALDLLRRFSVLAR